MHYTTCQQQVIVLTIGKCGDRLISVGEWSREVDAQFCTHVRFRPRTSVQYCDYLLRLLPSQPASPYQTDFQIDILTIHFWALEFF